MRKLVVGVCAIALAGCSVYGSDPTIRGVRNVHTNTAYPGLAVLNTGDQGSGPIQSVVLQQGFGGQFFKVSEAASVGTFQTFTEGALGAAFIAGGTAGFGALIPASKTVISNVGNSRSTGGNATGGAGGRAVATGGAGGGGGSAVATGGVSSASAVARQRQGQQQVQHQNATATSDAAASTGPVSSSSTSGGGIIPNGTILHTPGGDITVDPTVHVSQ